MSAPTAAGWDLIGLRRPPRDNPEAFHFWNRPKYCRRHNRWFSDRSHLIQHHKATHPWTRPVPGPATDWHSIPWKPYDFDRDGAYPCPNCGTLLEMFALQRWAMVHNPPGMCTRYAGHECGRCGTRLSDVVDPRGLYAVFTGFAYGVIVNGPPRQRGRPAVTPGRAAECRRLRDRELSLAEIASELRMSRKTVWGILHDSAQKLRARRNVVPQTTDAPRPAGIKP